MKGYFTFKRGVKESFTKIEAVKRAGHVETRLSNISRKTYVCRPSPQIVNEALDVKGSSLLYKIIYHSYYRQKGKGLEYIPAPFHCISTIIRI